VDEMKDFYTYMWLRENGTPYYVGKGKGRRAFTSNSHSVLRPKYDALILVQYWESEDEAFEKEKWFIDLFGRKANNTGILRNLTEGGENPPKMMGNTHAKGKKHSAEANAKKSERGKLRKQTAETREKLSRIKKGKSNGLEGKPKTEETKSKIREAHLGMKASEEARKNMSEAAKHRKKKSWPT
jgi:hypothetical protein